MKNLILSILFLFLGCGSENSTNDVSLNYIDLSYPESVSDPYIPDDNPLSEEG